MGVPPSLCVSIQDQSLYRFNMIDPVVVPIQSELTALRDEVGALNERLVARVVVENVDGQPHSRLEWNPEIEQSLRCLRTRLTRVRELRRRLLEEQLVRAEEDAKRLDEALPRRRQQLDRLRQKYLEKPEHWNNYGGLDPCQAQLAGDVDPSVFDAKRLDSLPQELSDGIARLREELTATEIPLAAVDSLLEELLEAPEKPAPADLYRQLETQVLFGVPSLLSALSAHTLDLSLLQARARVDSVELTPVDMPWDFAVELARRYRHDWMNARAALVDSWRLIYFNADALQSTLYVVFSGDIRNVGDNPFHLSRRQGQWKVGLQWDGPWTRLRERNTYRQALIEYQQARRNFYAYEDAVSAGLRDTIRTIELNKLNFEERRMAVLSAIEQIVLNDELQKFREERGLATGATAARDAVSALTDLQEAQNLFLGIWVSYEALRMILDLDLGTMQLDGDGNWIDPGPLGPDYGMHLPEWDQGGPELFFEPTLNPEVLPAIEGARPAESSGPGAAPLPPAVPMAVSYQVEQVGGAIPLSAISPASFLVPETSPRVQRLPPPTP